MARLVLTFEVLCSCPLVGNSVETAQCFTNLCVSKKKKLQIIFQKAASFICYTMVGA